MNAALLVHKALGLKQSGHQETHDSPGMWPWATPQTLDASGTHWNEINMARFLAESDFLTVEA